MPIHIFFLFFSSTLRMKDLLHSHNFQIFHNLEIIFLHQSQIYNNSWYSPLYYSGRFKYLCKSHFPPPPQSTVPCETNNTNQTKKENIPQKQITNKPTLGIQNDQQENQAVMNLRSLNHSVITDLPKRIKL